MTFSVAFIYVPWADRMVIFGTLWLNILNLVLSTVVTKLPVAPKSRRTNDDMVGGIHQMMNEYNYLESQIFMPATRAISR